MKTKIIHIALFTLLFTSQIFGQDVTTVRANNSDISDNLDLKAVASIFGDSRDLEDFERRLNDPEIQVSNLDLNGDNRVDYLRVIEATENNTHLIIIQSVLGEDTFQDVATIEVERDRNNNVQVQVVGDVYMYGSNYIYEPIYVSRPVIYDVFWVSSYRPYYSPWYWGYYPTYYTYWSPYPVYRYRNHVHTHINPRNTYAYSNSRRSTRAVALHNTRRTNAYERQHPNASFSSRNNNVTNRYALEQTRSSSRSQGAGSSTRNTFNNSSARNTSNSVRTSNINTVRSNGNAVRSSSEAASSRNNANTQSSRNTTPAQNNVNTSRPASTRNESVQPARNIERSAPARIERSAPSSAPARSNSTMSAPRSTPSVRSTPASAPARQSAPAPSRSSGNSTRNSRG